LDAQTVTQMTKLTMESAEYQKFATGFTKFVSDCNLGADAQKIPVTIWAKLIDGLSKSGYIKGAIKHVEGDPRQFILAEINSDGGKLIRDELLAQAMAGLQPFVDHAAIYLDKVIQKAAQGSTWAFGSGDGAKDAAKKESHGGIVLEGTVGAWFDDVWDFKALTSQAESLALWSSLSELYAKKAAEYFDKFKFIGFVGPGATRDQSVFNKIEQPTFVEVLNTKAQVQPPEIVWYLVDCEQADGKWTWTQKPSVALGNDRAVALAEVAKRYDNAANK
jgi:hypothetical protein